MSPKVKSLLMFGGVGVVGFIIYKYFQAKAEHKYDVQNMPPQGADFVFPTPQTPPPDYTLPVSSEMPQAKTPTAPPPKGGPVMPSRFGGIGYL